MVATIVTLDTAKRQAKRELSNYAEECFNRMMAARTAPPLVEIGRPYTGGLDPELEEEINRIAEKYTDKVDRGNVDRGKVVNFFRVTLINYWDEVK
jgi:hypothetical protein